MPPGCVEVSTHIGRNCQLMYNFTYDEQEQNFKLDIVFGFTPGQLRSINYFKTASANNGGQYVHTDRRN